MLIYIFLIIATFVTVLLILSFIAPQDSDRKFWIAIRKIRSAVDLFSYWLFNAIAICSVLTVVLYIIWKYVLQKG